MHQLKRIILACIPVLAMIVLIPLVANDYLLSLLYILIIVLAFMLNPRKHDRTAFFMGLTLMTLAEYLFIRTGVETFARQTLFGVMPLWLPLLWAYGFVAMKHIAQIISRKD